MADFLAKFVTRVKNRFGIFTVDEPSTPTSLTAPSGLTHSAAIPISSDVEGSLTALGADGIPGLDRNFTSEESDELYKEVREQVLRAKEELEEGAILNFYGLTQQEEELNALPNAEPEFYEVECTLDTGASTHAADRVDFPGYEVQESPGSRAGQLFGCAGGKSLMNEGQINVDMVSPIEGTPIILCTQVTKVTRPLLSVSKLTEEGKLRVLCDKDRAVVIDLKGKVLATFPKKNGLYVCLMKVRNPRFRSMQPFPRQLP